MRGRIPLILFFLLFLGLQLASTWLPARPLAPSLQGCAGSGTEAEVADCLERNLAQLPPGTAEPQALAGLVAEMPAAILELSTRRAARQVGEPPGAGLRAEWLDLQGRALLELDRPAEAAERLGQALSLDDGTLRLTWLSPEGVERWCSPLDPGRGRLERAALSLLSAGRPDEALVPLGRALALGAGGWAEETWAGLTEGPAPQRSEPPAPLKARKWFKPVPDLGVELADGSRFAFREDGRGRVLVLSFWATWCMPCHDELPYVQELYEAERENGLEALGVNADEPMAVAQPFADRLGLTFPIARGNKAVYDAFDTSALPVLAVVDRWGAVRGRWPGYEPGIEQRLFSLARRLLSEAEPPSKEYGEILLGGDRFEIAWLRSGSGPIDGLAVLPRSADPAGLLVSSGRSLALHGSEGETIETWELPAPASQLRLSEPAQDGRVAVLGFRAGSSALLSIDLPAGSPSQWKAPAPVFDAELVGSPGTEPGPFALLATMQGLWKRNVGGEEEDGTALTGNGASGVEIRAGETAVLEFGGRLAWRGPGESANRDFAVPAESWLLLGGVGSGSGVGVAPPGVRTAVAGRFLDRPGGQAALATESGQLVILDLSSGETLFRARWDGIATLAAGDLLGDGRDELIVADGSDFGVLKAK